MSHYSTKDVKICSIMIPSGVCGVSVPADNGNNSSRIERISFRITSKVICIGVEDASGERDVSSGSSTVSTSTIRPRNLRELIMSSNYQERFRSLVRDTFLPLRIILVYVRTTTAYVRSKLLAQRQRANSRAVVT